MIASESDHSIRWEPLVDVDCDFCPNTVTIADSDYKGRLHEGDLIRCSECGGEQPREFDDSTYAVKIHQDEPYMAFWDDASPLGTPIDNALD